MTEILLALVQSQLRQHLINGLLLLANLLIRSKIWIELLHYIMIHLTSHDTTQIIYLIRLLEHNLKDKIFLLLEIHILE